MRYVLFTWLVVVLAIVSYNYKEDFKQPMARDYTSRVSYETDIKPIFKKHCASCHPGSLTYEVAYDQRHKILKKFVDQGQMPPKHIGRPSQVEVDLVRKWIEQGARK